MSRSKARKERDALRTARRDALLILLSRAQRGVLTRPEAEQLRVHVEAELALADQTRASAGGQQAAQQRTAHQLEAAHEAIREAEQRAADAEEQLRQYRAVFGEDALDAYTHALARASRAEDALAEIRAAASTAGQVEAIDRYDHRARVDAEQRADRYRLHSEQLRHQLAAAEHRTGKLEKDARDNGADCRAEYQRAKTAEQQVAAIRAALPDEPRPRFGLPNDLAYANGRHDVAERVRYAIDHAGRT
ncbi:hypothetical protein [Streptomyces nigrescens]|uniref:hypothetical protein n=1 Tax=Streptomyces nigrescens TaxID=1920 RepID=UPI003678A301